MPTYDYICSHCKKTTEAFQSINEAPLVTCPHCGTDALSRALLSAPNFQLKGKGWYKTDYTKSTDTTETKTKETKETKEAVKPADTTTKGET